MPGYALKQLRCLMPCGRVRTTAKSLVLLTLLLASGLAVGAGAARGADAHRQMLVAATITPLGDFCRKIGGDLVQVQVLIPPGASPHVFEPPPSVMAKASQARVFVYIGAGLEPWAAKLLQSRNPDTIVVVEAARGVPLLGAGPQGHRHGKAKDDHAGHRHGVGEAHPAGNPHLWLDPVLAQDICRKIAAAFIQADPAHQAQYEAHLQEYLAALVELHREIEERAKSWRLRDYISFHPAFTYFARRYGLNEVGVIEAAPGREPTPRHLQNLVATIRRSGIKVVFAEPQLNPRVAEVIAQEAGVRVLLLDPVGGPLPYGSDYLKLMRHNLAALDEALR